LRVLCQSEQPETRAAARQRCDAPTYWP
jgi:hypothetical protein